MTTSTESRSQWGAVVVVSLGVVLAALDTTIVAVALPAIGTELTAAPSTTQWVLLGYSLPLVALCLPVGRWADRAGPLPAFRFAVGGFGAASALAAIAPNIGLLIAARVLQGGFGAIINVIGIPLVTGAVRPEHRARAVSIVLTLIPLSGVAGPAAGGVLTDVAGWRTVFLVNIPVVAVALALAGRWIPARIPGQSGLPRPDRAAVGDTLMLGTAVTALMLALGMVGVLPPQILPAVGLLVVALAGIVAWARRAAARPVLRLMRTSTVTSSLVALLVLTASAGAVNFLVPYVLDDAGTSASTAGLVLVAVSVGMAVTSTPAGVLADRIGTRPVMLAGAAAVAVGSAWLLFSGPRPLELVGPLLVMGVGHGLFAGPNTTRILDAVPRTEVGTASGVTSLIRSLGFTVGPALAALTWTLAEEGSTGLRVGALVLLTLGVLGVAASGFRSGSPSETSAGTP